MRTIPPMENIRRIDSDDMLMEQVEQALSMTPEERFRAGGELFDAGCMVAFGGIRGYFPRASVEECLFRLKLRYQVVAEADSVWRP